MSNVNGLQDTELLALLACKLPLRSLLSSFLLDSTALPAVSDMGRSQEPGAPRNHRDGRNASCVYGRRRVRSMAIQNGYLAQIEATCSTTIP